MRRIHADLLLIATAAVWGLAFVFQKTAMDNVGPLTFIAARGLLAALALAPFAWFEQRKSGVTASANFRPIIVAGGVLFFLGAYLQQTGLITATVSNAGFLTALYVIVFNIKMEPRPERTWSITPMEKSKPKSRYRYQEST